MCFSLTIEEASNVHNYIKWDDGKVDEYKNKLYNNNERMRSCVDNIHNDDDIDHVVNELTDTLYQCAFSVFGKTFVKTNATFENKLAENDWFKDDCKSARNLFHQARNLFGRSPTDANRDL